MPSIFKTTEKYRDCWANGAGKIARILSSLPRSFYVILAFLFVLSGWLTAGAVWYSRSTPREVNPPVTATRQAMPPSNAQEVTPPIASEEVVPTVSEPDTSVRVDAAPKGPGFLGIRGEKYQRGSVSGLMIREVFPDSPAALAGLRSGRDPMRTVGSIITKVNGRTVRSEDDLRALLQTSAPGDELKFLVTTAEGDSYQLIPVRLGEAPVGSFSESPEASLPDAQPKQNTDPMSRIEEEILGQVNRIRAEHGLNALVPNPRLQEVAAQYSRQMAALHFFSHIGPDGLDVVGRLENDGVKAFKSAGENIFFGQDLSTALVSTAIQGWMASPGHRRNMLSSNYQETGIGVAAGPKRKIYITEVFLER
jgi:uncharacterized protein YkwD